MLDPIYPIITTSILLFTLIFGVGIFIVYTERSPQRNILIGVFCLWIPIIALYLVRLIMLDNTQVVSGFLSNTAVFFGVICFLAFIAYGASVIFHMHFNYNRIILFVLPAAILLIASTVANIAAGLPFVHVFANYEDFVANIHTPVAILRASALLLLIFYIIFINYNIFQLVPIYNKYLQTTESDERYNLNWLYGYIAALYAISVVYTIFVLNPNANTTTLYSVVATLSFFLIIDTARTYKQFPDFKDIEMRWSISRGWERVCDAENKVEKSCCDQDEDRVIKEIQMWIIETKQYANAGFSTKDVIEHFPNIDNHLLTDTLDSQGRTFQSFVREVRIREAVRIFHEGDSDVKFKEICFMVGFSHYSSFSRAFTAVIGVAPTKYLR